VKVISEALPPPAGTAYPEGVTLRAVKRTKRKKLDFYETPAWAVDAVVPHIPFPAAGLVVDAGAGTGAIAEAVGRHHRNLEIIAVELQQDLIDKGRARGVYACEFVKANFETWVIERSAPDIVIMNPPYSRAIEFIRRAMQIVKRGGHVAALLRLGFMASHSRTEFHDKHPARVLILNRRPSFTGDGCTDASDYAWFVWGSTIEKSTWSVLHIPRPRRTGKK
jgi:hypothetical protein